MRQHLNHGRTRGGLDLLSERRDSTQLTLRRRSWADGGVRESTKRLDWLSVLSGVVSDRSKWQGQGLDFRLCVFPLDRAQGWHKTSNLLTLMKSSEVCKVLSYPMRCVDVWLEAGRGGAVLQLLRW